MTFDYKTAQRVTQTILDVYKGRIMRADLCKLLRQETNCMDSRWIKSYAMSMVTAGLIEEIEAGVFGVVKK